MTALPAWTWSGGAGAAPYLTFGLPSDPVAWLALGLAFALLALARRTSWRQWLAERPRSVVLGALAALAALLSAAYVSHYLRGGPRIVDATSYFLEARALAAGDLWFQVPEPRASFHGRFLLSSPEGLAVLFPPGYPLVLALGFLAGAPLAVGPVLAALLVPATYAVARAFGASRNVSYAAAALSVLSAALRYHTADTMSHGWSALLVALAVATCSRHSLGSAAVCGACSGWLIATRPVTGLVVLVVLGLGARPRGAQAWIAMLAALPPLAFWLWHQHSLTGEWLRSSQSAYYAVADGPPNCFRYGFGAGIGCWFEHGEFVRARLPDGYGFTAAAGNTLRRAFVHTFDVANAAPLALLVPFGAAVAFRERAARLGALIVGGVVLGYAPFYFEGSYPGGGARFFADVLPLEHAFGALAAARLRLLPYLPALSVLGFALHTSHQHAALAEREGGRPMFEPAVVAAHGVERGLVFVGTDHGFALGHDPAVSDARSGIVVARFRGDRLDRLLYEQLGRPPSFRYRFDPSAARAVPKLEPYVPASSSRIEGESLYPPVRVLGGFAHPEVRAEACASGGRALALRSSGPSSATVRLALPASRFDDGPLPTEPGDRTSHTQLVFGWVGEPDRRPRLRISGLDVPLRWLPPGAGGCRVAVAELPAPAAVPRIIELEARGAHFDYVDVMPR